MAAVGFEPRDRGAVFVLRSIGFEGDATGGRGVGKRSSSEQEVGVSESRRKNTARFRIVGNNLGLRKYNCSSTPTRNLRQL